MQISKNQFLYLLNCNGNNKFKKKQPCKIVVHLLFPFEADFNKIPSIASYEAGKRTCGWITLIKTIHVSAKKKR